VTAGAVGGPKSPRVSECYRSADGRIWWIDEGHPETNGDKCVCRVVERGYLMHTAVHSRKELVRL